MSSRAARGQAAEDHALKYLEQHGLRLKARNHRCRWGEFDLVMEDGEAMVFIEVRGRDDYGSAAASVDAR
jgi:putative endonuclease